MIEETILVVDDHDLLGHGIEDGVRGVKVIVTHHQGHTKVKDDFFNAVRLFGDLDLGRKFWRGDPGEKMNPNYRVSEYRM
jgi:hypothetical protein